MFVCSGGQSCSAVVAESGGLCSSCAKVQQNTYASFLGNIVRSATQHNAQSLLVRERAIQEALEKHSIEGLEPSPSKNQMQHDVLVGPPALISKPLSVIGAKVLYQQDSRGGALSLTSSIATRDTLTKPPLVNKMFLSNTIRDVDSHNALNIGERERAIKNAWDGKLLVGNDRVSSKRMRREDESERRLWQERKLKAQEKTFIAEAMPNDPDSGYIDMTRFCEPDDDSDSSDEVSDSESTTQERKRKKKDRTKEKGMKEKSKKKKHKKEHKKEKKDKKGRKQKDNFL